MPEITPLPIDPIVPEVVALARERGAVVVQAPPGAGKTTRIPPALAAGLEGRVLLVEPRRVAARAAARRIAEERGFELGGEVGYQVRFERVAGPQTRLLALTEGILLNLLQADPFLEGVAAVVFDEFHERNLASDLALAMAAKVRREVRPDLALVVMSATLETERVASFLGGAPVLGSEGRAWPVSLSHLPRPDPRPLSAQIASASRRLLEQTTGDLLVFLPGVGEIAEATRAFGELAAESGVEVVPLYGDLPAERQDLALRRGRGRRIVLSTNVAETSVTVEGVSAVIDSGLARVLRYDPGCGLDRLELERISLASAEQRAGRAGRLGPGLCLRLWTQAEEASLPRRPTPEVLRVDLAGAALQLAAWGEKEPASFAWFEAPNAGRLALAVSLLERLGALGGTGITPLGRRMASLPASPRLARLLLAGQEQGCLPEAALAAALLSERSPFERGGAAARAAEVPSTPSDLVEQLQLLESFEAGSRAPDSPYGRLLPGAARQVLRMREQLLAAVENRRRPGRAEAAAAERWQRLGRPLLAAFPDRLAQRREPGSRRGVLVGGRGVRLAPASGVLEPALFLCLDLDAGARGEHAEAVVRLASGVEEAWLKELLGGPLPTSTEIGFDPARERVVAQELRRFEDLVLDRREVPAAPEAAARVLAEAAAGALERILPSSEEPLASFLERLRCLGGWLPALDLPRFEGEEIRPLLAGLCQGKRSFAELRRLPWKEILEGLLSPAQLAALEREAPERLAVPSGSRIRIQYQEGQPPVLAARIQELFGLAETPRLAGGRVPVLLHLLAPSGRPQQLTQDLASFWRNTYPQVKKELAGRYPKHAWPSDPTTAPPEKRPGRR